MRPEPPRRPRRRRRSTYGWPARTPRAGPLLVHGAGRDLLGRASLRPRSSRPSLMCSYWRSRFWLQACCGIGCSSRRGPAGTRRPWRMRTTGPSRRVAVVAGPDFETQIKQLQATMHTIEQVLDLGAMRTEIADLGEQVAAPDLWDDQANATRVTGRLSLLQGDLDRFTNLQDRLDDLERAARARPGGERRGHHHGGRVRPRSRSARPSRPSRSAPCSPASTTSATPSSRSGRGPAAWTRPTSPRR